MIRKEDIKSSLDQLVTRELLGNYQGAEGDLRKVILSGLKVKGMDAVDIAAINLVVFKHLEGLKVPGVTEAKSLDVKELEDVGSLMTSLVDRNRCDIECFIPEFNSARRNMLGDKLNEIANERKESLGAYLLNPVGWSDQSRVGLYSSGVSQVYYTDMNEKWGEADVKERFEVRGENGFERLVEVFSRSESVGPLRFIDSNVIAIDFEDYGYHVKTNCPVSEFPDLIDIESRYGKCSAEYEKLKEDSRYERDIAYMLSTLVDDLNYFYGNDVSAPIVESGSLLTSLVKARANASGDAVAQDYILEEIASEVAKGKFSELIKREVIHSLRDMTHSPKAISDCVLRIRRSIMNRVDMSELDKVSEDFDKNVQEVIELKGSGDALGFKRKFNALNVFERMAFQIKDNENKGSEYEFSI